MMRRKRSQKMAISVLVAVLFISSGFVNLANAEVLDSGDSLSPAAGSVNPVRADEPVPATVLPGVTTTAEIKGIKATVTTLATSAQATLLLTDLGTPSTTPWQIKLVSHVFQVDLKPFTSMDPKNQTVVELTYDKTSNNLRQIFYYDKRKDTWRSLQTTEVLSKKTLSAKFPFAFGQVAIFEHPGYITSGKASWYNYKGGLFAASPDFPKDSRLRVFNLDDPKKFVDVTVNDFGPDRDRHPDRVIDLDKTAFKRIAPTGQGTARVRVEPLYISNNKAGQWQGQPTDGYPVSFKIVSKSAAVLDTKTGNVIWSKNSTSSMPIASLTKLVSAYVFLETKPSFNKVVPYSIQDENYNYKFARKWEVARLKVADGETMKVEDLFYSAIVGSANNAVESLVRVSGMK
ncbi:hypothetical protein HGA64_03130, partial [Candidatus Falkowbacteria bacterium]|nr:hypothetical protein [Candidatus Falkowbacteria bacterium]